MDDVVEGWHIDNVRSVYKQVHSKDAANDLFKMLMKCQEYFTDDLLQVSILIRFWLAIKTSNAWRDVCYIR